MIEAATIATAFYGFMEPYRLKVRQVVFKSSKIPPSFSGKTVLFLSDIHHGYIFSLRRVKKLVKIANGIRPDIVILGGDYVSINPKHLPPVFKELKRLKPSIEKFGVLGNHDYDTDADLAIKCMRDAGIKNLENRGCWVSSGDDRIRIGGVIDISSNVPQDVAPVLEGVSSDELVILVSHNPESLDRVGTDGIDLVLAGHTHGGQVAPLGVISTVIFRAIQNNKYISKWMSVNMTNIIQQNDDGSLGRGHIVKGDTDILISNGIGAVYAPFRIFARPEMILVTLENSEFPNKCEIKRLPSSLSILTERISSSSRFLFGRKANK
jgi:predicted MPP superfamily phosphohydrolase